MPVLLEGKANFSKEEEGFIQFVSSDQFPWFLSRATQNFSSMIHTLLNRTNTKEEGKVWSPHYEAARVIFNRICRDNNIVVREVYRMGLNLTFPDPSLHGDPHNDHEEWPHKIMIIYLNKFDDGGTWLFNEDGSVETKIEAEMDKFVVFEGKLHANGFCKPQQTRTVLVATFDGDILPSGKTKA